VLLLVGRPGDAHAMTLGRAQSDPAIRLLGHRADVPDLMCAADVLSFPSRWEGLPGTLIEAMALRLGFVASDIPQVSEAVGDVGWPLVPPDDASALADGLASVLRRNPVHEAWKDAGERRFHALFTAEAASVGMMKLYRNVLRNTSSPISAADTASLSTWTP
jgi:glycosyltransferase involved in cell wall biosynthesis